MEKYKTWDDVPDTLATKTQLSKMGLKPAKDQKPAAIKAGWKRYGPYDLFEVALAIPKRKLTEAQILALEAARRKAMTTTCCNRFTGVINWREKGDMCLSCYIDWQEQQHEAMLTESKAEATEWARGVLADPAALILDTETTGLAGRIVEISIIRAIDGIVLLNTLINPECPIPASATAIHGITDEMVESAPVFDTVYYQIKRLVEGAGRVVIYNAEFDKDRLWSDTHRCELPLLEFKSECAMLWYAAWYGDWSNYHKSFRWQRLSGGHRALGDCEACLEQIKRMAKDETQNPG